MACFFRHRVVLLATHYRIECLKLAGAAMVAKLFRRLMKCNQAKGALTGKEGGGLKVSLQTAAFLLQENKRLTFRCEPFIKLGYAPLQ